MTGLRDLPEETKGLRPHLSRLLPGTSRGTDTNRRLKLLPSTLDKGGSHDSSEKELLVPVLFLDSGPSAQVGHPSYLCIRPFPRFLPVDSSLRPRGTGS